MAKHSKDTSESFLKNSFLFPVLFLFLRESSFFFFLERGNRKLIERPGYVSATCQLSDLLVRWLDKRQSFHHRHLNAWMGWTSFGGHCHLCRRVFHSWPRVEVLYMGCPNPETVQRSGGMISNLSGCIVSLRYLVLPSSPSSVPTPHLFPIFLKFLYIPCWQGFLLHHFYRKCMFSVWYL